MARAKTAVRLAVIASSVLLAAGFISYRAGAFSWLAPTNVPAIDGEASSSEAPPSLPAVMSGSKSSFSYPIAPTPPTADNSSTTRVTEVKPPYIMSGSKSVAPLVLPSPGKPTAQPPNAQQAAQPGQK
jgi:hypothetical protein